MHFQKSLLNIRQNRPKIPTAALSTETWRTIPIKPKDMSRNDDDEFSYLLNNKINNHTLRKCDKTPFPHLPYVHEFWNNDSKEY